MKYLYWAVGAVLTLVLLLIGLQRLAAERIEVVELHTLDETGDTVTTRLWVVDDAGFQYLRVGATGSGWFSRIEASEQIQITRGGETADYSVTLRPEKSERINELMQAKYTWGDSFIGTLVGNRENSIPIELHPL